MSTTTAANYRVAPWLPVGQSGAWRVVRADVDPTCTELWCGAVKWMDDFDSEYEAHREFIERAEGRVLITGLGLGWLPNILLQREAVRGVDVIESSMDVIRIVRPHLLNVWPVEDGMGFLRITHGDARWPGEWQRNRSWDWAWHDITADQPMEPDEADRLESLYAPFVRDQLTWRRRVGN